MQIFRVSEIQLPSSEEKRLTFVVLFQKLEAVGLVPSSRKDIEGDLAANGKGEFVAEFLFQRSDHRGTNFCCFVVLVECVAL